MVPSLPLLSCESSVSVKENPDRKKRMFSCNILPALQSCSYESYSEICSKFTAEHSCQSVILIKSQSNFIEIALRHECSPSNLLHIFRTPFIRTALQGCFLNDAFSFYVFAKKVPPSHTLHKR